MSFQGDNDVERIVRLWDVGKNRWDICILSVWEFGGGCRFERDPPENRDNFAPSEKIETLNFIMTIIEEYIKNIDHITSSVCLEHYLSL